MNSKMNYLFLAFLQIWSVLAFPDINPKRIRSKAFVPLYETREEPQTDPQKGNRCNNPCDDCNEPDVETTFISPVKKQSVEERAILVCAPGSYWDRIEFEGCYESNTTCNGAIVTVDDFAPAIYTAFRTDPLTGEVIGEHLNGKELKTITLFNNGASQRKEQAELYDCGACDGNTLVALSSWLPNEPLTGCCGKGVNHLIGASYQINIWGKCCSECYLVQASQNWKIPVKN